MLPFPLDLWMLFYVHYEARENATTHGILDQRYPSAHDIAGLLSFYGVSISKHVDLFYSLYTFLYLIYPLNLRRCIACAA